MKPTKSDLNAKNKQTNKLLGSFFGVPNLGSLGSCSGESWESFAGMAASGSEESSAVSKRKKMKGETPNPTTATRELLMMVWYSFVFSGLSLDTFRWRWSPTCSTTSSATSARARARPAVLRRSFAPTSPAFRWLEKSILFCLFFVCFCFCITYRIRGSPFPRCRWFLSSFLLFLYEDSFYWIKCVSFSLDDSFFYWILMMILFVSSESAVVFINRVLVGFF